MATFTGQPMSSEMRLGNREREIKSVSWVYSCDEEFLMKDPVSGRVNFFRGSTVVKRRT